MWLQVEVDKLNSFGGKNIISNVQWNCKGKFSTSKANYSGVAATVGYATIKALLMVM
jgi:membrane fusion protein (multidrug efflux system)